MDQVTFEGLVVASLDLVGQQQREKRDVIELLGSRQVFIADGHHRYETALEYAKRNPAAREKLMAFFPLEGPGLTIFANHRLVDNVPEHVTAINRAGLSITGPIETFTNPLPAFTPDTGSWTSVCNSPLVLMSIIPVPLPRVRGSDTAATFPCSATAGARRSC